jgi:hypothetical protein
MDKIFMYISQSNDKKFHYNIKRGCQYVVSAYDGFKTYNEAEIEGQKILNKL